MLFGIAITAIITHAIAVAGGALVGYWAKAKLFVAKVEGEIDSFISKK